MPNKSYVIWNNKGGVGKSTITFHVSSVYAEMNPDRDVVVIDMCPQANSSMMLLGGGKDGENHVRQLLSLATPKTVVGYITDSLISSEPEKLKNYLVKISDKNNQVSNNIYLLCGDGNLELIAPLLSERANALPLSENDKPWEKIHLIIKNLTSKTITNGRPVTYFIDTNPSFSIYTEMAILGGNYLLVPINADDSSIYAISGLFNLIFGSTPRHPVYGNYTFASKVDDHNIKRPKIYLLLGNRFTQLKGAAHAFKALSNEATKRMYEEYKSNPDRFRDIDNSIDNQGDFDTEFTIELRDFNSAGVVAANLGKPLSKMDKHDYKVYGENIQVSKEQRKLCKETIEELVKRL